MLTAGALLGALVPVRLALAAAVVMGASIAVVSGEAAESAWLVLFDAAQAAAAACCGAVLARAYRTRIRRADSR